MKKHLLFLIRNFNSIKVRLELLGEDFHCKAEINFNSIKVRLELKNFGSVKAGEFGFQFHKGTIRTGQARYVVAKMSISIP